MGPSVDNGQLAALLTTGFAVAYMGWAVVYLTSSHERAAQSQFRRWLRALWHRLLTPRH
jgi:hypothetical protein